MDNEKDKINFLIEELSERITLLSEKQNSQYTDIMLSLKRIEEVISCNPISCLSNDELYDNAKEVVIDLQKASASLLQRSLGIGYAKAARLLDMLEENGVISQGSGAQPRDVLVKE